MCKTCTLSSDDLAVRDSLNEFIDRIRLSPLGWVANYGVTLLVVELVLR